VVSGGISSFEQVGGRIKHPRGKYTKKAEERITHIKKGPSLTSLEPCMPHILIFLPSFFTARFPQNRSFIPSSETPAT
jgi:hypothetical protein